METHTRHQTGELDVETLDHALGQRRVAHHDDVLEQRGADVDVACHDRVVDELRERHEVFERVTVV